MRGKRSRSACRCSACCRRHQEKPPEDGAADALVVARHSRTSDYPRRVPVASHIPMDCTTSSSSYRTSTASPPPAERLFPTLHFPLAIVEPAGSAAFRKLVTRPSP